MFISNSKVGVGYALHKGRGVYSLQSIACGEVVEVCPLIPLEKWDKHDLDFSLDDYVFESDSFYLLALGYGSLYNHSTKPNATCTVNLSAMTMTMIADVNISVGEEITICYNIDFDDDLVLKEPEKKETPAKKNARKRK